MQVKTVWRLGIMMTTMLGAVSLVAQTEILALEQPERRNGQHDWDTFFRQMENAPGEERRPLAGSHEWQEYDGTIAVSKLWNGRANIAEVEDRLREQSH